MASRAGPVCCNGYGSPAGVMMTRLGSHQSVMVGNSECHDGACADC